MAHPTLEVDECIELTAGTKDPMERKVQTFEGLEDVEETALQDENDNMILLERANNSNNSHSELLLANKQVSVNSNKFY